MLTYSELASFNIPVIQKLKAYTNFWRFSFNSNLPITEKIKMTNFFTILLLPIGYILYLRDKTLIKK
jgi:hypothetical protein